MLLERGPQVLAWFVFWSVRWQSFFFFSSTGRHTRCLSDWSSDVCSSDLKVDHILLTGGCAMLDGLEEMVAQRTQVHTVVANPFANMALSSKIKPRQLTIDAPSLMVACGLAMRRFDPS